MRKMKYIKLFESYGSGPDAELVDSIGFSNVEEYFDKHLKNTDFDDIVSMFPSLVWDNVDDDAALEQLKDDEISNYGVDDFNDDDFREYIKEEYAKDNDTGEISKIYQKHISSEVDIDELKDIKSELKDETDDEEKKRLRKEIRKINKEVKRIKELDFEDLLDEMSEDDLKEIVTDVFDDSDFVVSVVEERYKSYRSLQDYVESTWGSIDSISFGGSFGKRGDWDWILNYVDDDDVVKEYNENESDDYKEECVQEEFYRSIELQEKALEVDTKNALLLYDLFVEHEEDEQIKDTYDFQKAYVESYSSNYVDDEDDVKDSDITEGKALAIKNLYDEFGLASGIEDSYSDCMFYVVSDRYNL